MTGHVTALKQRPVLNRKRLQQQAGLGRARQAGINMDEKGCRRAGGGGRRRWKCELTGNMGAAKAERQAAKEGEGELRRAGSGERRDARAVR